MTGRGPRLLEAFSRAGASGARGVGGGFDLAGRVAKAYPRTDTARNSMNPAVEAILDEALGSGEDPAVTNFLLNSDEKWRQSGVEDEP